ncbi:MAG: serine hydrolase [Alcanivoracaceae bacterium]|nr:serine hydrolase [Alcanivoracaceae bacterium]
MKTLMLPLIASLMLTGCGGGAKETLFLFNEVPDKYLHNGIAASTDPYRIPKDSWQKQLPLTFNYNGLPRSTYTFMQRTGTGGMVVIEDGEIVYENYFLGTNKDTRFTSWSVAKSITSALVGIAVEQGYISSVDDLVSSYVPELLHTAYGDVTIRNALQMSSGVDFDESGANPNSDAFQLLLATLDSNDAFIYTLKDKRNQPGTYNYYASSDTQVLGMVLSRATGQSVSRFMETNLWQPLGAEKPATWVTDTKGVESFYCCVNATLRDYAKFGMLYLNKGEWRGHQLLSRQWVEDSLATSEPQLVPGDNPQSNDTWGYGYQWWIPDTRPDYMAIGIFNQFIYVHPGKNMVIIKFGANPEYVLNDLEDQHLYFFRKVARHFKKQEEPTGFFSWFF